MLTQLTFPTAQIMTAAHMRRLQIDDLKAHDSHQVTLLPSRRHPDRLRILSLPERLRWRIPRRALSW